MYKSKTLKALQTQARAEFGVKGELFSIGADAKTVKGEKRGFRTAILYLMPDDTLCPMARIAGCREGCLVASGRAACIPGIGEARKNRSNLFFGDRWLFMELARRELVKEQRKAHKEGKTLVVRMNGTSDVDWSGIRGEDGLNIFELFPSVQFYDYTKSPSILRKSQNVRNWDVTASYSEASAHYAALISEAAQKYDANLAVVFRDKNLPHTFKGIPVVNGYETDLRFMDERGVIVGLKAKGPAKKDQSGFVIG